jgi:hypothetical protein
MSAPVPGLRAVRQFGATPVRVELIVAAGDTLEVSDDVAGQLMAASSKFRDATPAPAPVADAETEYPAGDDAPKRRGRKANADS